MKKDWLHATSIKNKERILEDGFKLGMGEDGLLGRFGDGIYFMNSEEYGFGGENKTLRIIANIDEKYIINLTHQEICLIFWEYNLEEEEEGISHLEEYVKSLDYKAVNVIYADGTTELVVYDTTVIEIKDCYTLNN